MKSLLVFNLVLLGYLFACGRLSEDLNTAPENTLSKSENESAHLVKGADKSADVDTADPLKIFISKMSKLFVNGQALSINDIKEKMKALKDHRAVVYLAVEYDRSGENLGLTQDVIDLINLYKPALETYTDSTFSEIGSNKPPCRLGTSSSGEL